MQMLFCGLQFFVNHRAKRADLREENPRLFDPKSDLITPEEYERMSPELKAKVETMPPGVRYTALPPLPADVDAVSKVLIPKLESVLEVESLWALKTPNEQRLWVVRTDATYEGDKLLVQAFTEMMDMFPRYYIDYYWVIKDDESDVEILTSNGFVKVWDRK